MPPVRRAAATVMASAAMIAVIAGCGLHRTPGDHPVRPPKPAPTTPASPTATPTETATSDPATPAPTEPTVAPTHAPTAPTGAPAKPTFVPPTFAPPQPPSRPAPTRATTPPAVNPPAPVPPQSSSQVEEVIRLTNEERAKAGCRPLQVDSRLMVAAQRHSEDMAANNYFSHYSPSGTTPAQRAMAAGFPSMQVAENIAAGSATAAQTVQMWMNSSGHRQNILNCATTHIGVGYATGGSYRHYWTQNFGKL